MKKNTMIKAFAFTCLTTAMIAAAPFVNAQAAPSDYSSDDLVWSDEFDGDSLNTNNWTYEIGNGNDGWGNQEVQYYTNYKRNVFVTDISSDISANSEDGKALAIRAMRETTNAVTSGRIITKGKQSFKYGRIEARLKVEHGMQNAVWPAFWMLGSNIDQKVWPACDEIDIMEHANSNGYISGTLHYADDRNNHQYYGGNSTLYSIEEWHTYAVEWNENSIDWYMDNTKFYSQPITAADRSELHLENFIILNVAIGGPNTGFTQGKTLSSTFTDATMYVDYVRVYQNDKLNKGHSYTGKWIKDKVVTNRCHVKYINDGQVLVDTDYTKDRTIPEWPLEKEGYKLEGWYTSKGVKFDFSKTLDYYMTDDDYDFVITARWTKLPASNTKKPAAQKKVTVKVPTISKLKSPSKRKITIKVKSKDKAKIFQIRYGKNKKITKGVKTKKITKTTLTIKGLKSKQFYYFKVREAKKKANGKLLYSKWTKVKRVTVK